MIRKAFVMKVHPHRQDEYAARHNPVWEELQTTLKSHGVQNYSIFLNKRTSDLFAYAEIESEDRWNAIAATPVCRRWWAYMKEVMPVNPDESPQSELLWEVFHL